MIAIVRMRPIAPTNAVQSRHWTEQWSKVRKVKIGGEPIVFLGDRHQTAEGPGREGVPTRGGPQDVLRPFDKTPAHVAFGQRPACGRRGRTKGSTFGVDHLEPIDHFGDLWPARHDCNDLLYEIGIEDVVRIKKNDGVSSAARESSVAGGGLPSVRLIDWDDSLPVVLDYHARFVRRSIVDHNYLNRWVTLGESTIDSVA